MVKKNKNFLLLSACVAVLSFSIGGLTHGDAQNDCPKTVVANYEKLLQLLPEYKITEQEFRDYLTSQQEIQKKQLDALKQKREDLKKNEKTLSAEELKIRKENLSRDEMDLQRNALDFQRKMEDRNMADVNRLKDILEKNYIDPYAKNNKIDIILNSEGVNKIYNTKFDITDVIAASIKKNSNKPASTTAKK